MQQRDFFTTITIGTRENYSFIEMMVYIFRDYYVINYCTQKKQTKLYTNVTQVIK